ncbi:MAG: DUF1905 domain-containing protein [Candidatus Paceibacterota bacterium]
MKKTHFKIVVKVWLWPGQAGWHFATIGEEISEVILQRGIKGMIPIEAQIGKTKWLTSLFPHKMSRGYIICLKKDIRKKEDIFAGDSIKLSFKVL